MATPTQHVCCVPALWNLARRRCRGLRTALPSSTFPAVCLMHAVKVCSFSPAQSKVIHHERQAGGRGRDGACMCTAAAHHRTRAESAVA